MARSATAARATDTIAEIAALVPKSRRHISWWERVDSSVAAQLPGILQAWHDGEFGEFAEPASKAIAAWLGRNGFKISDRGVLRWLKQNPQQ